MDEAHVEISKFAKALLDCTSSKLVSQVSSHTVAKTLALNKLTLFLESQSSSSNAFFIGALSNKLTLSATARASDTDSSTSRPSKKRRLDDSDERADAAVKGARRRLGDSANEDELEIAKTMLANLLRLRGQQGEHVVETVGLSVGSSPKLEDTAPSPPPPKRPRLIVCAHFAAGVAVSVAELKAALADLNAKMPDGMLTVDAAALGPEYKLPVSELSTAAGQAGMFLFVSVQLSVGN